MATPTVRSLVSASAPSSAGSAASSPVPSSGASSSPPLPAPPPPQAARAKVRVRPAATAANFRVRILLLLESGALCVAGRRVAAVDPERVSERGQLHPADAAPSAVDVHANILDSRTCSVTVRGPNMGCDSITFDPARG